MIPPIAPLGALHTGAISSTADPAAIPSGESAPASGADSFSNAVTNAVDSLQAAQATASSDEAQAAAGQGNLADTMIAATKASLDTEVTTSLLSQATTAYNSIMNMSL